MEENKKIKTISIIEAIKLIKENPTAHFELLEQCLDALQKYEESAKRIQESNNWYQRQFDRQRGHLLAAQAQLEAGEKSRARSLLYVYISDTDLWGFSDENHKLYAELKEKTKPDIAYLKKSPWNFLGNLFG
jgi:AAA15 family ATPase/GTPase